MDRQLQPSEYPLSSPYCFEGYRASESLVSSLLDPQASPVAADEILVVREGENLHATWGRIYALAAEGPKPLGRTLEPRSNMAKGAVPLGRYPFNRWMSPKLGKTLRLHDVPGFTDILIHVGNFPKETSGCILAGRKVDSEDTPTKLKDSRTLTDWLFDSFRAGFITVRSI